MILAELIDDLARITGIADRFILRIRVNEALHEIWETVDLPGSHAEAQFQLTDSIFTVPYFVGKIRAAKPCCIPYLAELSSLVGAYREIQSYWRWAIVGETPMEAKMAGASKLTITLARQVPDRDVEILINGSVELAEQQIEIVKIPRGSFTAETENVYTELQLVRKREFVPCAVIISDNAGTQVSYIAASMLEARNTIVKVIDPNIDDCVNVLYKKYQPPLYDEMSAVPWSELVKYRALSNIYIANEKPEQALVMAQKFNNLLNRIIADHSAGMTRKSLRPAQPVESRYGL